MTVEEAIKLTQMTANVIRSPKNFSWGSFEDCKKMFEKIFLEVDKSVSNFKYLPQYDEVVNWMTGTQGKGLYLYGDCGMGKSTIIKGIVPVLFRMRNYVVKSVHADDLQDMIRFNNMEVIGLEYLLKSKYPIIDELGVETKIRNYGEVYEGFIKIINRAEAEIKPLFVSTNLSLDEILTRYGERTVDRISRLCKLIELRGKSLR